MSAKKADSGSRVINALAGMAAAFVARKVLHFAWTKITGKEPPEHPEDPQVALGEALVWGVVVGAGVHIARLLATRATGRRALAGEEEAAELAE
ncbi:MAG TPA: DUF4235 domain-containing protein [Streptosporangiaceae bacterium]|jgi:hypothetical protein